MEKEDFIILYNNAGYREKEILNNIKKIVLVWENEDHKVFRFFEKDNFFDYDTKTKKIVG